MQYGILNHTTDDEITKLIYNKNLSVKHRAFSLEAKLWNFPLKDLHKNDVRTHKIYEYL